MARETRTATDRLITIKALVEAPHGFDFHQAMRRLECAFRELPRWGEAALPSDEPVRIGQNPSMAFAPSAVEDFEAPSDGAPGKLRVAFFGLFGPNGPLPTHMTEYVRERLRHAGDRTLVAFADVFHHRMFALFHRAWSVTRPVAGCDRPESDRLRTYVASLFGLGFSSLRDRDSMPDRAKLKYAALLAASPKSAAGLRAAISSFFELPVEIEEYIGQWLEVPADSRFRLGHSPEVSRLGRTTVLGGRVYDRNHKFRVALGPLSRPDFLRFLPGTPGLDRLRSMVRNYTGDELAWDVRLIPAPFAASQIQLGMHGRLGWDALLGRGSGNADASDVIVDPSSHETGRVSTSKPAQPGRRLELGAPA
jgi:type VI secretion system protein ImpH